LPKTTVCTISKSVNKSFSPGMILVQSHNCVCVCVCVFDDSSSSFLTGFVCMGRRSRTPPPRGGQLEAEWHRTRTACVCRCGRPCACTDPILRVRPHTACSPGSPPRCPRRSSPLGSFSATTIQREEEMMEETEALLRFNNNVCHTLSGGLVSSQKSEVPPASKKRKCSYLICIYLVYLIETSSFTMINVVHYSTRRNKHPLRKILKNKLYCPNMCQQTKEFHTSREQM